MSLRDPVPRPIAVRATFAAALPVSYRPRRHVCVNLGLGALATGVALAALSDVHAIELLAVPSTFVGMNLLEYFSHRYLMHRRTRLMPYAFEAHALRHHRSFAEAHMSIASAREIGLIVFGVREIALFLLATLPGFALLACLASRNAGLLAVAAVFVHYLLYEGLHLVSHLPEAHWVARQAIFASSRRRHARHHGAVRKNFNVTLPLSDWLFGTLG